MDEKKSAKENDTFTRQPHYFPQHFTQQMPSHHFQRVRAHTSPPMAIQKGGTFNFTPYRQKINFLEYVHLKNTF